METIFCKGQLFLLTIFCQVFVSNIIFVWAYKNDIFDKRFVQIYLGRNPKQSFCIKSKKNLKTFRIKKLVSLRLKEQSCYKFLK